MRGVVILAMLAAFVFTLGCTSTNDNGNNNCALDLGGGGTGGEEPGTTGQPIAHSVQIGFGAYAAACSSGEMFLERASTNGGLGSLASQAVHVPFPGTIIRATVVHAIDDVQGFCNPVGRDVLVSEPTNLQVPTTPGLHERLTFSAKEVAAAPVYEAPGITSGYLAILKRDLAEPIPVDGVNDRVHLASPFEVDDVCATACGSLIDGSEPPEGSFGCTNGEAWNGCSPSGNALVGWFDVIPD